MNLLTLMSRSSRAPIYYRFLRGGQRKRNGWSISAVKVVNLCGADGQSYAEYSKVLDVK